MIDTCESIRPLTGTIIMKKLKQKIYKNIKHIKNNGKTYTHIQHFKHIRCNMISSTNVIMSKYEYIFYYNVRKYIYVSFYRFKKKVVCS